MATLAIGAQVQNSESGAGESLLQATVFAVGLQTLADRPETALRVRRDLSAACG